MKMTVGALNDLRCEDKYLAIFEEAVKLRRETVVPLPALPRQRRQPRRFGGPAPAQAWTTAGFRSQFFQVVDTAVNHLKVRYDQAGLHQYIQLENALMTADTSADEQH